MKSIHVNGRPPKEFSFFFGLILTLLFSYTVQAQVNNSKGIPSYTNYTVSDLNIAGQQIWNVNQDQAGFIYTGTSSGLQKFDGINWELLRSPVQDYNTNVRATLLSSAGEFYYGSIGDFGYVTLDSTGNTMLVSIIDRLPEDLLFNDIWSIREVDEKIYFQSRTAIFIYSPNEPDKDKSIEIWKPDTQFMYSFNLNGQFYTHQMNLGLYRENNGSLVLVSGSEFLGQDRVQVLLPFTNSEEFLVAAFSGGMFHYDGENFQPFATEIDSLIQDRSLYKAIALPDETYALSVLGHGFFILDQQGKVRSQYTTKNSITDQSVYSFHLDTYQNLWVGTNNGLSKIELFSPVTRFDSDQYEMNNVLSLNAYGDNLYMGNSTNVLYIDQKDGIIKQVEGFSNSQVFDIEADKNQVLTTGAGVYRIRGNKAEVIPGTEAFQTLNIHISDSHPGYVYISGAFGIHVLKRTLGQDGEYQYRSIGPISDIDRYVYTLVEDKDGELWGGSQAGILYRILFPKTASGNLDIANANVAEFSEEQTVKGLSGTVVNVNGKVYTSGIDGFYYFDKETERFVKDPVFSFSEEVADINLDTYGLASNQFGDVFLDFKGEKRLAKLQPDSSYELQSYPFNLLSASIAVSGYTEPNGVFWFGTDAGLLRIDPNSNYKVDYEVPLYFTSVTSGDQRLELPQFMGDEGPELEYQGNKISFHYIAPFFIKEEMNVYQSYLEGYDEDWIEWGDNINREFTNLSYGSYTFRVKAKNVFGTVSEEAAYSFVILPPWYASWWAYIVYFSGFGFLVFGLVKVQTNRIVAKEKERNREKELEQAKEIEKAYENLKAAQEQLVQQEKLASLGQLTAGIAHEIKNPLNFVNNFSDINKELISEAKELAARDEELMGLLNDIEANLDKIHEHGTRADSIVKSMLLHSRGGSGDMEPTDLNEHIKEYVNLAFHGMRAGKNPINVNIDLQLDPDIDKVPVIQEDFSRVILNLCNNSFDAMKAKLHDIAQSSNDSGYKPVLTVKTSKEDGNVLIEVQDNGPGIPEEIQDKILQPFFTTKKGTEGTGLGLSITNDIIKAHGGQLTIDSKSGKNTTCTILLEGAG